MTVLPHSIAAPNLPGRNRKRSDKPGGLGKKHVVGLLKTTAIASTLIFLVAMPKPALAQFAWVGATNNYNLGTNWSPPAGAPPVAAGQSAQFANTGSSSVVVTAPIAPDSWTFNNNAQAYTMTGAAVNFSTAHDAPSLARPRATSRNTSSSVARL